MRKLSVFVFAAFVLSLVVFFSHASAKDRYFVGVGVRTIQMNRAGWTVLVTYHKSPIEDKIMPADAILEIDGNDISNWPEQKVLDALNNGLVGSVVHLKMSRWFLGPEVIYEVDVAREKIDRVAGYVNTAPVHSSVRIPKNDIEGEYLEIQSMVSENTQEGKFMYTYRIVNEASQDIVFSLNVINSFNAGRHVSWELMPRLFVLGPGEAREFSFESSFLPGFTIMNEAQVWWDLFGAVKTLEDKISVFVPEDWLAGIEKED